MDYAAPAPYLSLLAADGWEGRLVMTAKKAVLLQQNVQLQLCDMRGLSMLAEEEQNHKEEEEELPWLAVPTCKAKVDCTGLESVRGENRRVRGSGGEEWTHCRITPAVTLSTGGLSPCLVHLETVRRSQTLSNRKFGLIALCWTMPSITCNIRCLPEHLQGFTAPCRVKY